MKVGELRVGNIISHEKCPIFRVDEIRLTENGYVARMYPFLGTDNPKVLDSWLDLPLRGAQPVVLTEEILRDWCGFNTAKRCYGLTKHGIDLVRIRDGMYYENRSGRRITDLHTLQNYVFYISGNELDVKLPASV